MENGKWKMGALSICCPLRSAGGTRGQRHSRQADRQAGGGSTAAVEVDHAERASYSTAASIAGGCSMYQLNARSRRSAAINAMILQFLRLQD